MPTKIVLFLAGSCAVGLILGLLAYRPNPAHGQEAAGGTEKDQEAIRQSSKAFARAYAKGDARALAALWTQQGEHHDADGQVVRGQADLEKAFRALFEENPKAKIEVLVESIRSLGPDLAIEEGILRRESADPELPATTLYSAIHHREAGEWKIALSREWGAGQDRLEDLAWLVGQWQGKLKDQETALTIAKDPKKPVLVGKFTRKAKGKVVASGTMRIWVDPQNGQLRSAHFDDDGGFGQSLWLRDGNRWALDAIGVLADGSETASVNILGRINKDAFTWQSLDRVVGDEELPNTVPVRLKRVTERGNSNSEGSKQ
jgi:uncharacterized protein (TIGR02246 family)